MASLQGPQFPLKMPGILVLLHPTTWPLQVLFLQPETPSPNVGHGWPLLVFQVLVQMLLLYDAFLGSPFKVTVLPAPSPAVI